MRSFEECIKEIDEEIAKRRYKWTLTAISWMDFDDVSQIIRLHIFKKWHLYDQSRPLKQWVNRVVSSQMINLSNNNYKNFARPCLGCAANEGNGLCSIYKIQSPECPLYAHWEKTKKRAYDVKLPVTIEQHETEMQSKYDQSLDLEKFSKILHIKMFEKLTTPEWILYDLLYIKGVSEEDAALKMGYKTNEKNKLPGYKTIKKMKKSIIQKAKKCFSDGEIEFYD